MSSGAQATPSSLQSIRDTLLVARYHCARALRTRSALNLCALFILCATGMSVAFRQILKTMENVASQSLGVPQVDNPGTMFDTLRSQGDLDLMFEGMVGNAALVEWAMSLPYMTITWVWGGMGLVPFLAAAVGAEGVSPDLSARTIRFEAMRTGRLEIVGGRYLGMCLMVLIAITLSVSAPFCVAVFWMTDQPVLLQLTSLLAFVPRLWLWSLPFVALGLSCSCMVKNVNWARLGSTTATVFTWVASSLNAYFGQDATGSTLLGLLLPQGWLAELWGPGFGWVVGGMVLGAIGVSFLIPGYIVLQRRDL